jgi:HSP20 family protein
VEKNVLEISSEKKDEKVTENQKYLRKEFNYSEFRRTFSLPVVR